MSVAVIEAGPSNTREIDIITTPAKAFETRNSKWDWKFKATFVDRDDYTRVEKPDTRGKVLGGSSCLNYYTWVRGSKGTFDDWKAYGGDLWGWNQCEEYFDKPATYHDERHEISASIQRINRNGPLPVSVSNMLPEVREFRNALEKAWTSKGHPLEDNVYEGVQRGLVKNLNSIYNGVRSTSVCFLDGKPNITIISETNVDRLIIDKGVATGVEVTDRKGNKGTIKAKMEVILSAGVFKTPQILMLSGIGPKEHLQEYGIQPVVDSKHVGQNLLDHPIMPHVFQLKKGTGLDHHIRLGGQEQAAATNAYSRDHSGPLSSGLLELVGFPRIDERLNKYPQYRKRKEDNGGLDPFGPDG